MYGPGRTYHVFAGRDASTGFAKNVLTGDLNDNIDGLSDEEIMVRASKCLDALDGLR